MQQHEAVSAYFYLIEDIDYYNYSKNLLTSWLCPRFSASPTISCLFIYPDEVKTYCIP